MHYFQFNIGDYASHTRHLTLMEDLAYRRLLDLYYMREGCLVGDVADIARQIGMRDHAPEVAQVLSDFFISDGTNWRQERCDAEIQHFRQKSEKASNAGKASAQRRLNKRLTDVQPTNNQQPITNNQETDITPHKPPKGQEIAIPDWMPRDAWDGWLQMRKQRKKPLTDRAATRAINKLDAMRQAGQDIAEVLDRSTLNGWTDLYEIKEQKNGNFAERKDGVAAEIDRMLGFGQPAGRSDRQSIGSSDGDGFIAIAAPDPLR